MIQNRTKKVISGHVQYIEMLDWVHLKSNCSTVFAWNSLFLSYVEHLYDSEKQRAGETVWVFVCACMYIHVRVRACVHLVHGKKSAQFST